MTATLTYGSVCSGIEAATVAWHPLGRTPLWFSQFDPEHNYRNGPDFPSRVLAHHYPHVPNLGNMLLIEHFMSMGEIEAPDVLVGGTPCQAFSTAGLRNSMDDTRGQLTLHYVTLADKIDELRAENGKEPAIIVWENVPGCLNTKDNAFGCFVGALAGDVEIHPPVDKRGKRIRFPDAGCVVGTKRTVAWRVLDAQYFNLAQRRRRVFVVASAREGLHPAQVLFEFDGVCRDTPPSRETGEEVAGTTAASSFFGGAGGKPEGAAGNHFIPTVDSARSLLSKGNDSCDYTLDTYVMSTGQGNAEIGIGIGTTLNCNHEAPVICTAYRTNAAGQVAAQDGIAACLNSQSDPCTQVIAFAQNLRDEVRLINGDGSISGALSAQPGMKQTTYLAFPIDTQNCTEGHNSGGKGFGEEDDPSFTLSKGHSHAVAFGVRGSEDLAHCLRSEASKADKPDSTTYIAQDRAFNDVSATLKGSGAKAGTADPSDGNGHSSVGKAMQVRRLTPAECARLQGFPDNYLSQIPKVSDGHQYKALGNSMAVPVMNWIGKRILWALENPWSNDEF